MIKKVTKLSAIAALSTTLFCSAAYAKQRGTVALGVNASTTGLGIEARTPISDNLYGRIGVNYSRYTYKENSKNTTTDMRSKLNLKLMSAPLMIDWHPVDGSGFRLSAGVAYNGNEASVKTDTTNGIKLNGIQYSAAEVGELSSKLELGSKIAGIASIGYDNSFLSNNPLSFNFEIGAMYTGNPKLKVKSTGLLAERVGPEYEEQVNKTFNSTKKYLRFFPVLKIGIKYTF